MSFYNEDPIIKSNNETFYSLLKSLKKKQSVESVLDYLESIDDKIDLNYDFSNKSTYATKIFKSLKTRPEHLKALILYSLKKNIKNPFSESILYMSFPRELENINDMIQFAFNTPECYALTKDNYDFWGNYIIDNFEIQSEFNTTILKHFQNRNTKNSDQQNSINHDFYQGSNFSAYRILNKMTELYGSDKYKELLDFLKIQNFDFSLTRLISQSRYYKNINPVFINFHKPSILYDKTPQEVITDYLSFLKIEAFPEYYQKLIFKKVISDRHHYIKADTFFFNAFFNKNEKLTFPYQSYDTEMDKLYSNFFNCIVDNNISPAIFDTVCIEEKEKIQSFAYGSTEEQIKIHENKLLEKIILKFFDNNEGYYNHSMHEKVGNFIVDQISNFGSQTSLLIEQMIEKDEISYFQKIYSRKMQEFNEILTCEPENLYTFINSIKLKLNSRNTNIQVYADIISTIKLNDSVSFNFEKLQLESTSFDKKQVFFDFIFKNNKNLGLEIFEYYSDSITNSPFVGFKNIEFHEHYLNNSYFTNDMYFSMNKRLIASLNIPKISQPEAEILEKISIHLSEKEKSIILNSIYCPEDKLTDKSKKRI